MPKAYWGEIKDPVHGYVYITEAEKDSNRLVSNAAAAAAKAACRLRIRLSRREPHAI